MKDPEYTPATIGGAVALCEGCGHVLYLVARHSEDTDLLTYRAGLPVCLKCAESDDTESECEDPTYPVRDWQYQVANGDTRLGYAEWVRNEREANHVG